MTTPSFQVHVGVDTGGTFTDVVIRGDDGALRVHKVLSTPHDPSEAIARGVAALVDVAAVAAEVVHGTTVATNALLERRGARVVFVTTAGFEDLLFLRRQNRPELYAFDIAPPRPLAAREDCLGVRERVRFDGQVEAALDDDEVTRLVEAVRARGAEAVAICLLHAYANPAHEQQLAAALAGALPGVHVSVSHEIVREFREYERASTTTINAFVGPVMARYLDRLRARMPVDRLEILQSHGGRTDLDHAARFPVHTVLSGPAGGVVGALQAAHEVGVDRIITFDMGGTSTDVSLCDGAPSLSRWSTIDELPLGVPVIDIYTVGAGGGSIAAIDPGGALRVGPRSAGASPGPAAYGQGGREPTVTDAHVVLGSLRPEAFLGGAMSLDAEAARAALESLAAPLGMDHRAVARGVLDIADATMVRAIKVISLERGHDPRDFVLVAFGGAGGLHACRLAEALEMRRVLVPRNPGLLSARGMLHADRQRLFATTVMLELGAAMAKGEANGTLRRALAGLERQARAELVDDRLRLEFTAELRYEGQSFEIAVPVAWRADAPELDDPHEAFAAAHEQLYGYRADERRIELVTLRLQASVPAAHRGSAAVPGSAPPSPGSDAPAASEARVTVGFGDGDHPTRVVDRAAIAAGQSFEGPAVVTEYSGTLLVPPGWVVREVHGHLLVEHVAREEA